jgi:uncharacterized membrane protein YdjX (TVP38/TMEM64 family)
MLNQTLSQSTYRWVLLCTGILAIILIPFFLFGEQIETWTETFLQSASDKSTLIAVVLGSLLAIDILVPVPSSLTSTAAGFFLGLPGGIATSLAGMTISCVVGYWLGARFGRPVASRLVGNDELTRLEKLSHRFGNWVIVVTRAVPVLAEASVLFAGISGMPMHQFLLLSTLSNLGVSVVYAAVGAFSANVNSFLFAFGGSILVPLVAMILTRGKQDR